MSRLQQKISAFFRASTIFKVVDSFLLILPWSVLILISHGIMFWLSISGLTVMVAMLFIDRPSFSSRYFVSAFGLCVIAFNPVPLVIAIFCAHSVAAIFNRDVGFSFEFGKNSNVFADDFGFERRELSLYIRNGGDIPDITRSDNIF